MWAVFSSNQVLQVLNQVLQVPNQVLTFGVERIRLFFFDTSSKDGIFMRGRRGGIMGQHTIDIKVYKETDANDSGTDNSSFGTDLINGGEGSGGCNKYNGSENDATVARKTLRKSAKLDG